VTYLAFVSPVDGGSAAPTGVVQFSDGGVPISSCAQVPLYGSGGVFEANCTVSYSSVSTHNIRADYGGDSNFSGVSSGTTIIPVSVDGLIGAPMRWTFASNAKYTKVLALAVKKVQAGSTVLIVCRGKGCPYARKVAKVSRSNSTVNLTPKFSKRQLKPGTKITVSIVRPGWMGRYYQFTVRAGKAPKVTNGCLAEGTLTQPKC
jgi:hypothetical protein